MSKDTDKKYNPKLFKAIAISLPILFLFLLEGVLRIMGYGDVYPLFIPEPTHAAYYKMNQQVSLRYFQNQKLATWGQYDPFKIDKPKQGIRIVIQGASTGVGFPFMQSISYSKMIERWLQKAYPDLEIEVINTSLAATNSFTMLDFVDEILAIHPDLILIYGGHNEYYGVLGAASSQRGVQSPRIKRWMLALKDWRLMQLLRKIHHKLFVPDINEDATLMANMIGEQKIALDSKLYRQGIEQFCSNMSRLLAKYEAAEIPVLFSTLVSNEKGIPPFESIPCEWTSPQTGGCTPQNCSAQDWYDYAQANIDEKCRQVAFHQAKELDALRFRAPKAINTWIKSISSRDNDVSIIDMDSIFRWASSEGIVGSELMTEHVHPNVAGYYLLAQSFLPAIAEKLQLDINRIQEQVDRYDYMIIDSIYGEMLLERLTHNWPFVATDTLQDPLKGITFTDPVTQLVSYRYRDQLTWIELANKAYERYTRENQWKEAERIAANLVQEFPFIAEPKQMVVNTLLSQSSFSELASYLDTWKEAYWTNRTTREIAFVTYINTGQLDKAEAIANQYFEESGSPLLSVLEAEKRYAMDPYILHLEALIRQHIGIRNQYRIDQLEPLRKTVRK